MKDKDAFWDLSALIPPQRKSNVGSRAEFAPTELTVDRVRGARENAGAHPLSLMRQEKEKTLFREYSPEWNPMIHSVRISKEPNTYKLYHLFREDAIRYLSEKGSVCEYAPCYSYIPQYSQLNAAQRAYYFYFRGEAQKENYIQISQSYFLLYVYEILNLPDYIDPKEGILRLAKIWAAYRKQLPAVEKYMASWIADYALIHGVPCPSEVLQPFLTDVLSLSSLKEFYLGSADTLCSCQLDAILSLSSAYQYQNGRYAKGEMRELFLEHVGCISRKVVQTVLDEEGGKKAFQTVTKEYPAYIGALCSEAHRYTIGISYCSVSGTEALGTLLTSVVKYAENKVRAALSIKSRLSVPGLPSRYKNMIDAYFESRLPVIRKSARIEEARPAYEAMYDAPSEGFSEDMAQSIEALSWENTRLLITEEEAEEVFASPTAPVAVQEVRKESDAADGLPLDDVAVLYLLFHEGEARARSYALKNGLLFEGAVERINDYFTDTVGDIVILLEDAEASVLEEYETEVTAYLAPYQDKWKTWM